MKQADYIAIRAFLNKEVEVLEKDMEKLNLQIEMVKKMIANLESDRKQYLEENGPIHIKDMGKSNKEDIKKQLNEKYGIAYIDKDASFASVTKKEKPDALYGTICEPVFGDLFKREGGQDKDD